MHSTAPRTSRTPQRLPTAPPARPPETRSRRLGGRGRAPPPPPSRRPPPTPPRRHRERHHHLPATRVHHRPRRGDRRRHPRLVVARQRYRRSRLLPDPGRLPRTPVQQARGHCPPPRWRRSRRVHPARVRAHPNRGLPVTAADRPSDTDNARAEQRSEYTVQQTAAHFARKVQRVSDRIRSTDYQRSVSDIVALDNVEGFLDRIARDDLDVFAAGRAEAERPACTWPRCKSPATGKCFAWCKCICHEWSAAQQAAGRAETTIEATERIARQIAASTAMTGTDARQYVEAIQAIQHAETTTA